MGEKDTKTLESELLTNENLTGFIEQNKAELYAKSVPEFLNEMLIKYDTEKNEVLRRADMAGNYGYQIFDGSRNAGRDKLLKLAFGFPLTKEETDILLRCAGYAALYVRDSRDTLIMYALHQGYNLMEMNNLLFERGEKIFE